MLLMYKWLSPIVWLTPASLALVVGFYIKNIKYFYIHGLIFVTTNWLVEWLTNRLLVIKQGKTLLWCQLALHNKEGLRKKDHLSLKIKTQNPEGAHKSKNQIPCSPHINKVASNILIEQSHNQNLNLALVLLLQLNFEIGTHLCSSYLIFNLSCILWNENLIESIFSRSCPTPLTKHALNWCSDWPLIVGSCMWWANSWRFRN